MILICFDILQMLFQTAGHFRRSTNLTALKVFIGETGFNSSSQQVMHDFLLYGQTVEGSYYVLCSVLATTKIGTLIFKKISDSFQSKSDFSLLNNSSMAV
jgi:hypothetical protein